MMKNDSPLDFRTKQFHNVRERFTPGNAYTSLYRSIRDNIRSTIQEAENRTENGFDRDTSRLIRYIGDWKMLYFFAVLADEHYEIL